MKNDGATLKVNSKLNEFTIQQILGAGTFGVTYLAYDNYLDKQVVIKEYFPNDIAIRADSSTVFSKSDHDKESFEYGLDSFMKEAKTIAKFDHPNVVKINSFFEANNTAYFVMDYYKGQDLDVYLQQNPQLSEEQILDIIIPLLDGLREVHSKSYLHRDIKPGNIYLKSNGSPMLIDFGATRYSIGAKSQSLSVILTPGYAPKEQYSSRSKQDACTDIYAIGAVLYKIVTGASPIEASERSDIITNDEPDPHIGLMDMDYPNYSEHFKKAVDWALALALAIVATAGIAMMGMNYYNEEEKKRVSKELEDQKEAEKVAKTKKEFGESIDRGSYIKPALVKIRAGSFTMGSESGKSNEKPLHKVTINYDFAIGKYEVTIGEYKKCVADGGCKNFEWLEEGNSYNINTGTKDYYKKMCLKDSCPAIGVSWYNAKSYTQWLSQKTGEKYRLPTEAEWEFAARAGTETKWSFGNNPNNLKQYAWYSENSNTNTHVVGTKKANPWGIYDIHGNVWEWCEDWYVGSYNLTPKDGNANVQGNKDSKVLRSGSWGESASYIRSVNRGRNIPSVRSLTYGFRLQRTLP